MAEEAEAALGGGRGDLGRGGAQRILRRRLRGAHFARGGALVGAERKLREASGVGCDACCVLRAAACGGQGRWEKDGEGSAAQGCGGTWGGLPSG